MSKNTKKILPILIFTIAIVCNSFAQTFQQIPAGSFAAEAAIDSVVTVFLANQGQSAPVGSGLIVRPDGLILTAYHLVKGGREVQIRLRNGETFDKSEIVAVDERRDVVVLRVNASGLHSIPNGTIEEAQVGTRIFVVGNPDGQTWIDKDKLLKSVQLADNITGAGKGFRLLQFDAISAANSAGALVIDENGRSLGIVTTNPDVKNQNIAVPMTSLLGLIRAATANSYPNSSPDWVTTSPPYSSNVYTYPSSRNIYVAPTPVTTPYPIPQSSVQMPQRGVTPLEARGPGSSVIKPLSRKDILAASKTIYVTSKSVFFKPDQLVNALNKRDEMTDWDLSFVDERGLADLILEIDHLLFTYKFMFKLYSQRLGSIIATGDVIIFDGNLGAPDMAKRVIEKLEKVRGEDDKKAKEKDKKSDKKTNKKDDN